MTTPLNKDTYVVFDTNSYRDLVSGKKIKEVPIIINELKALEEKKRIKACGALIVGMEMLSHLSDNQGRQYDECLCGIQAMALHCSDRNMQSKISQLHSCIKVLFRIPDKELEPRIIAQPVLQYAKAFFNVVITEKEKENKNIASMIRDFGRCWRIALKFHNKKPNIANIKEFLNRKEEEFADSIIMGIDGLKAELRKTYPTLNDSEFRKKLLAFLDTQYFMNFQALALIAAVAQHINHPISAQPQEMVNRALEMNKTMPLAAGFYCWVYLKVVNDTIDMKSKTSREKRWNWIWDYQVSILISESKINNKETILVTTDKGIREALDKYGYTNRVMTFEDYRTFLNN